MLFLEKTIKFISKIISDILQNISIFTFLLLLGIFMKKLTQLAVVGYGLVGKIHAQEIIKHPESNLCAIVEPNAKIAKDENLPSTKQFPTLNALLDAQRPDGIILATPTSLHISQGLDCIKKEIPILIEKPISVHSKEAKALLDKASDLDVPVLVGHHRRHNNIVKSAKNIIDSGQIGEICSVHSTCWFYKPDSYFENSKWRTQKGAGPILVNLVHDIDLLRYLCGEVETVFAVSAPSKRGYETESVASAILKFQNGVIATISVSDSIAAPWSWEMTSQENDIYPQTKQSCYLIGGSEASISLPDLTIWKHKNNPNWWTEITPKFTLLEKNKPFETQLSNFINVIKGIEEPVVSGIEGYKSLQIVESILLSSENGTSIGIKQ